MPQILCWRAFASSDISRWGHFQHADESAYYEFMCKEAGIHVLYCAEQFENDGSFVSARNAALTHQATCRIDVGIEAMRRIWSIVLSRRMAPKAGRLHAMSLRFYASAGQSDSDCNGIQLLAPRTRRLRRSTGSAGVRALH